MGIWAQASEVAAATPPTRNRYADFLRAASIMFVIVGHWLMTTAHYDADSHAITPVLALEYVPWSAWLTWSFQVMPIFFIVGGYSNSISLESARSKNLSYSQWLAGRLHRLLTPLTLLVVFWAVLAILLNVAGITGDWIQELSRVALVPTWFLAIYTMIVLLAPATYALWRRWGFWSLAAYILLAVLVDVAFFALDFRALGWSNYFWVWLAMHHLGFAWRDGRIGKPAGLLVLSVLSLVGLYALTHFGPYPIAMAGSPGEAVSNSLPPKITLIVLGMAQFGFLLALEKPMQRFLAGQRAWTCTVIVNTMIMTIYLWHMSVQIALLAGSYYSGGFGIGTLAGSGEWWLTRPVWLIVLTLVLIPVAMALSPLERLSGNTDKTPSAGRLVAGAILAGAGITLATLYGFDGDITAPSNTGIIALMLGGAFICGVRLTRSN